jgi:hypothetical protein
MESQHRLLINSNKDAVSEPGAASATSVPVEAIPRTTVFSGRLAVEPQGESTLPRRGFLDRERSLLRVLLSEF